MRIDRAGTRRASAALHALIATLGCSAAPDGDALPTETVFPVAYVHDDCAPWDGLALTFVMAEVELIDPFDVSYPHLRITSWRPPARLAGSSIEWSGDDQADGYAELCESAEACEAAPGVRLLLDPRQDVADQLGGEVRVELEGGRVMAGRFQAERIPFVALCG